MCISISAKQSFDSFTICTAIVRLPCESRAAASLLNFFFLFLRFLLQTRYYLLDYLRLPCGVDDLSGLSQSCLRSACGMKIGNIARPKSRRADGKPAIITEHKPTKRVAAVNYI